MAIYTVQWRDASAPERARFIPDRFAWGALLFAEAWLLFHRLWLALLIWLAAEVAFIAVALPHVGPVAGIGVGLLARLWLAFEAHRLRVAKDRRRAVATDVVEGRDRDGAEVAFFAGHGGAPGQVAAERAGA